MALEPVYRHWTTSPVRGREIDANNDAIVSWLNGKDSGADKWTAISATLAIHANNAAALGAGLIAGQFYRTGGDPDLVCVVH
jgi:hypothetical protein